MHSISPQTIAALAGEVEPYVVDCRRRLHEMAELSGEEIRTSAFIRRELAELGIPWIDAGPTSPIGILDTGTAGRCVALRADIDALPIVQNPCNLAGPRTCTSQTPGVCHACGHDGHAAMLLGTARILARLRDEGALAGRVLLCFESAEETMTGFPAVLEALEEFPIDAVWGIHLYAGMSSGTICVDAGPRMAGATKLDVLVRGKGGHGSRPDMARNPVFCAAAMLTNLAASWVNQLPPTTPVTLGPTAIQGGDRFNIIPDEARLMGSLRFFDPAAGAQAARIVHTVAEHTAAMYGCTAEVQGEVDLAIPVVNDAAASALAREALTQVLPAGAVVSSEPWFGSESFGHYLSRYPGVFAHLGIANPAYGSGAAHHTPEFDIDEDTLVVGVAATLAYTAAVLERGLSR